MAKFTVPRSANLATEYVRHELHPVADAEHRDAQVEELGIAPRGSCVRHAAGAARKNQADRVLLPQTVEWRVERNNLRVHRQLAKTPGDKLRVLRSEIEYQNGLMGHGYETGNGRLSDET